MLKNNVLLAADCRRLRVHPLAFHPLAFAVGLALGTLSGSAAYANPTGAQVVHGTVQFANPAAGQLNVTNSPGAIIHWNQFSVGVNETTRFIQQSTASAVLNRVTGADVSQILGNLQSNGRVFLINNNGVVFGQNAVVDTAGFVASTLDMSNEDFRAGRYQFAGDDDSGSINNQGMIRAGDGGNVILIAPHIENGGVVEVTDGGNIVLAAGKALTLTSWENPTVQFQIQAPEDSVVNLGKILANGGAARIFAGTVRHSGEIRADGVRVGQDGAIEIFAKSDLTLSAGSVTQANGINGGGGSVRVDSATGTTTVAGAVSATNDRGAGGRVELLGEHLNVTDSARIDVSGNTGGGRALIGGDFQGSNGIHTARTTYFASGARIASNAGTDSSGSGGTVIVWSDENTRAYGHISAQAGNEGGDGGFVEVSGKDKLTFFADVDLSAPKGQVGTLYIDPTDGCVVTQSGGSSACTTGGFSIIAVDTAATSNLIISATNNLQFQEALNFNTSGGGLTATAGNVLDFLAGAGITTVDGGISLTAPTINLTQGLSVGGAANILVNGTTATTISGTVALVTGTGTATIQNPSFTGGTTNIGGSFTTSGNVKVINDVFLTSGVWTNSGTLEWLDGNIDLASGTELTNQNGASLIVKRTDNFESLRGAGTFRNFGVFQKVLQAATSVQTQIDAIFINESTGIINIDDNELRFTQTDLTNRGNYDLAAGTQLSFSGFGGNVHVIEQGASFTGPATGQGVFQHENGVLRFNNTAALTIPASIQTNIQSGTVETPGAGGIIFSGPVTIDQPSLNLTNAFITSGATTINNLVNINSGVWTNTGTVDLLAGRININTGTQFLNQAGANFNVKLVTAAEALGSAGTFRNEGTFRKQLNGTSNQSSISSLFENAPGGVVAVDAGSLLFSQTNISNEGNFNLSVGTQIGFSGFSSNVFEFKTGSSVTGTGTLQLDNGILRFSNISALSLPSTISVNANGGDWDIAGTGGLTVNGAIAWNATDLQATNAFTTAGTTTVTGFLNLDAGTWTNSGLIDWQNGQINLLAGTQLINANGATFKINRFDANETLTGAGTFLNQGTFQKVLNTTSGETTIDVVFTNAATGVIDIDDNGLRFVDNVTQQGNINLAANTQLRFVASSTEVFDVQEGASFTGPATGAANLQLDSGILRFSNTSALVLGNSISVGANGGDWDIAGTGGLTVNGDIAWNATDLQATNAFTTAGTTTVTGFLNLDAGTWTNSGLIDWQNGQINLLAGTQLINANGATFKINRFDANETLTGAGTFLNQGTFQKVLNTSSGETTIDVDFTNAATGVIDIDDNGLRFVDNVTQQGQVNLADNTRVRFNSSATEVIDTQQGASFVGPSVGSAAIEFNSGTFRFSNSSVLSVPSNVVFEAKGGSWEFPGAGGLNANVVQTANVILSSGTWLNKGTHDWQNGFVSLNTGTQFTNASGATFKINRSDAAETITGAGTFRNEGTLQKIINGVANETTIDSVFTNAATGVIDVDDGSLRFVDSITQQGQLNIAANALLRFNLSSTEVVDMQDGATIVGPGTGSGAIEFNSGIFRFSNASVINGPASVPLLAKGGTWEFLGAGGLNANVVQSANITLSSGTWLNKGAYDWKNGFISLNSGTQFTNASGATFKINRSDAAETITGAGTFRNEGTLQKIINGVANETTIDSPFTNAAGGIIDINDGTLKFVDPLTQQGQIDLANNTRLRFSGNSAEVFDVQEGASVVATGTGTIEIDSGVFRFSNTTAMSLPAGLTVQADGGEWDIAGIGGLTVNGMVNWASTSLSAGNPFNTTGTVSQTGNVTVNSGTWGHSGVYDWQNGFITLNAGTQFTNANGATFKVNRSDAAETITGAGIFRNEGTFQKVLNGVANETTIDSVFTNTATGVIDIDDGSLRFVDSVTQQGQLNIAANALLRFNLSSTEVVDMQDGTSIVGPGTGSGAIEFNSGIFRFSNTSVINGPASVPLLAKGGSWEFPGAGGLNANVVQSANVTLSSGTWLNKGTYDWQNGFISLNTGTLFTNASGATFKVNRSDAAETITGAGTFRNEGTFQKVLNGVANETTIDSVFTNTATGVIDIDDGALRFVDSVTQQGQLNIAANALLRFNLSSTEVVDMQDGTSIVGPGTGSGAIEFNSGIFRFSNTSVINAPASVPLLAKGGSWEFPGAGGLNANVVQSANVTLSSGTWLNKGAYDWQNGFISLNTGTQFTNASGAIFKVNRSDAAETITGVGTFRNEGTFQKVLNGVANETTIDSVFTNTATGVIDIDDGSLRFVDSVTQQGQLNIAANALLRFNLSSTEVVDMQDGTSIVGPGTGSGAIEFNSGIFRFSNTSVINAPVSVSLLAKGGSWEFPGAGGLNANVVQSANVTLSSGTWLNKGAYDWQNGFLTLNAGTQFTNASGATFKLNRSDAAETVTGTGTFRNEGTLLKQLNGTANETVINTVFENAATGTVDVNSGTLTLKKSFNNQGVIDVGVGTNFKVTGSTVTFTNAANAVLQGTGTLIAPTSGINNLGVIRPGTSPGTLFVNGDITLGTTSVLEMEIAGTAAGQFDELNVSGNVTLGGTLKPIAFGGYTPVAGDLVTGIVCNSGASCTSGDFTTVDTAGGLSVSTVVNPLNVVFNISAGTGSTINRWLLNVDGDWNVAANWSLGALPDATNTQVVIDNAVTVSFLTGNSTISTLDLIANSTLLIGGGNFVLNGDAILNGNLTVTGGTYSGTGTTTLNGALDWQGGTIAKNLATQSVVNLNTTAAKTLSGASWSLDANTATWNDGNIVFDNSAQMTIGSGAVFDVRTDADIQVSSTGGSINNLGVLRKSAGNASPTQIATVFNNQNRVEAQVGELSFIGDGTDTGTYDSATGASIELATQTGGLTGRILQDGVQFTGAGDTRIVGNAVAINGVAAGVTVAAGATLNLAGVAVGGMGKLTNNGSVQAFGNSSFGGTFNNVGDLVVAGLGSPAMGAPVFGDANLSLTNLSNSGTVTLTNQDSVSRSANLTTNGGTLINSGTIKAVAGTADGTRSMTGAINNQAGGSIQAVDTNLALVGGGAAVNYTNAGRVQAQGGNVSLSNYGTWTNTGTVDISAGRTFSFDGGTFKWDSGAVQGGGNFQGLNGAILDLSANGARTFNANAITNGFTLGAGSLSMQGGNLSINGNTVVSANATLAISGGSIVVDNAAVVDIAANALVDIQADVDIGVGTGGGTINNAGTLRKSVGAPLIAQSRIEPTFNNTGRVEGVAGELIIRGSGVDSGIYDASAGALVFIGSESVGATPPPAITRTLNDGVQFTGAGITGIVGTGVNIAGSTVQVAVGSNFALSNTVVGGSGTLTNNGNMLVLGSSSFASGQLDNVGSLTLGNFTPLPAGDSLINNVEFTVATLNNSGSVSLTNTDTAARNMSLSTSNVFNNSGSVVATVGLGGGTRSIGGAINNQSGGTIQALNSNLALIGGGTVAYTNAGTVQAQGGNVSLSSYGTWTNTGTVDISAGRTFSFDGGTFKWDSGAVQGGGNFQGLNGAMLDLSANGARIFNANAVTNGFALGAGSLTMQGGSLGINGDTTVDANAILAISGGSVTIDNGAVVDIVSGGLVDIQGDINIGVGAGGGTINNAGTLRKSVGVANNESHVQTTFNNSGKVEVTQGELFIDGSGNDTGEYAAVAGTFLHLGQENTGGAIPPPVIVRSLQSGTQFTGTGIHVIDAKGVQIDTTAGGVEITSGAHMVLAGATIGGTGTLTNNGTLSVFGVSSFTNGRIDNNGSLLISNYSLLPAGDALLADASLNVATLNNAGSLTMSNSDTSAHNLALTVSNNTLVNTGTITAQAGTGGGTRVIAGKIDNRVNGTITAKNTDLVLSGNQLANIDNAGTIHAKGGDITIQSFNTLTQVDGGKLQIDSGRTLILQGNSGTIDATNPHSGFDWQGGDIIGGGTWINTDVNVLLSGTGTRVFNAITSAGQGGASTGIIRFNGGSFEITGGSFTALDEVEVSNSIIKITGGSFNVQKGLELNAGATLKGIGTISGNVTNSAGTVSPGNSPGALTVDGNYIQGADGALVLEIQGISTGEFDQLKITGKATLAGKLTISPPLPGSFLNSVGVTLALITAEQGISGVFDTQSVPDGLKLDTDGSISGPQKVTLPDPDPILVPKDDPVKTPIKQDPIDSVSEDGTDGDDSSSTGAGSQDDVAQTTGDDSASDGSSDDGSAETGDDSDQTTADDFETDDLTSGDDSDDGGASGDDDAGSQDGDKKEADGKDAKSDDKTDDEAKDGDKDEEDKDADKKKKSKKKADKKKQVKKKKRKVEACK